MMLFILEVSLREINICFRDEEGSPLTVHGTFLKAVWKHLRVFCLFFQEPTWTVLRGGSRLHPTLLSVMRPSVTFAVLTQGVAPSSGALAH